MKLKKAITAIFSFVCILLVTGCGSDNNSKSSTEAVTEKPEVTAAEQSVTSSVTTTQIQTTAVTETETSAVTTPETEPPQEETESVGWRQLYANELNVLKESYGSTGKFALIYIDGDEIPELVVQEGNPGVDTYLVYGIRNDEAARLSECSANNGSFRYIEEAGVFTVTTVSSSGYGIKAYDENGNIIHEFFDATPFGMELILVDNENVTYDEYQQYYEKYDPNKNSDIQLCEFQYELNDSGINQALSD